MNGQAAAPKGQGAGSSWSPHEREYWQIQAASAGKHPQADRGLSQVSCLAALTPAASAGICGRTRRTPSRLQGHTGRQMIMVLNISLQACACARLGIRRGAGHTAGQAGTLRCQVHCGNGFHQQRLQIRHHYLACPHLPCRSAARPAYPPALLPSAYAAAACSASFLASASEVCTWA